MIFIMKETNMDCKIAKKANQGLRKQLDNSTFGFVAAIYLKWQEIKYDINKL